jgi:hypothetical protein
LSADICPLHGTIRSLKAGRRWEVYAFVARTTFFAEILPRGVETVQVLELESGALRDVAGVRVWRLNSPFKSLEVRSSVRMWETNL